MKDMRHGRIMQMLPVLLVIILFIAAFRAYNAANTSMSKSGLETDLSCSGCTAKVNNALNTYCLTWLNSTTVYVSNNETTIYSLQPEKKSGGICSEPHYGTIVQTWNPNNNEVLRETFYAVYADSNKNISKDDWTTMNSAEVPIYKSTDQNESAYYSTKHKWEKSPTGVSTIIPSGETCTTAERQPANESWIDTGNSWTNWQLCLNQNDTNKLIADLALATAATTGYAVILGYVCALLGAATLGTPCAAAAAVGIAASIVGAGDAYLTVVDADGDDRGVIFSGNDVHSCIGFLWWKWSCVTVYIPTQGVTPNLDD
jgi:hypothetical protein